MILYLSLAYISIPFSQNPFGKLSVQSVELGR